MNPNLTGKKLDFYTTLVKIVTPAVSGGKQAPEEDDLRYFIQSLLKQLVL